MFHRERDWRTRILEMPFVPETMAVKKLMSIFLQRKKSLGVVIDEFGGTSGLISLEDIVEEIFGELKTNTIIKSTLQNKQKMDNTCYQPA